eukprot:644044-Lingulodinium_polyedra.AAC.1
MVCAWSAVSVFSTCSRGWAPWNGGSRDSVVASRSGPGVVRGGGVGPGPPSRAHCARFPATLPATR